jgi:hypothetical protein
LTDAADPAAVQGLRWLRTASAECLSAYSLAWSTLAFVIHQDEALDRCTAQLFQVLSSKPFLSNVETLSLAAIAIKSAEGHLNPFQV